MMRLFYTVAVFLAMALALAAAAKDWSKVNFDSLEKEWQEGDEPDELETGFEAVKKLEAKRRAREGKKKKQVKINPDDPKSIKAYLEAQKMGQGKGKGKGNGPSDAVFENSNQGGGEAMIFVELEKAVLSDKEIDRKAAEWASLTGTAGLEASVYKVDKDTMLVRVTKSWDVKETMKFLARQPLVSSMTLDSKKYTPSDFYDEDGDEL